MTVSELIERLKLMPQEAQVCIPEMDGGAPEEVRVVDLKAPESWMNAAYVLLYG